MTHYLLFKQVVCVILFFETLVLWPRFQRYFGPPFFPESIFTSPVRIALFHIVLLTSLVLLFFNYVALLTAFFVVCAMRYLYISKSKTRMFTFGAVGHMYYFTAAYLFLFEAAFAIDPTNHLANFFHTLLAIELGIMMVTAGVYKYKLGYTNDTGYEFALVNPSWGKFHFLFKKVTPRSLFFTWNNYAACALEIVTGLLFFIPQTRQIAAIFLILIFTYIFLTVRVNVLALLMISMSLLFFGADLPVTSEPSLIVRIIEALFIAYLVAYILIVLELPLSKFFSFLQKARPYFRWSVFAPGTTQFFVHIEKVTKGAKEVAYTYGTTLRFLHHHETSALMQLFSDVKSEHVLAYAKTLLPSHEREKFALCFTIMRIYKTEEGFVYLPYGKYYVDIQESRVMLYQIFTPEGVVYTLE